MCDLSSDKQRHKCVSLCEWVRCVWVGVGVGGGGGGGEIERVVRGVGGGWGGEIERVVRGVGVGSRGWGVIESVVRGVSLERPKPNRDEIVINIQSAFNMQRQSNEKVCYKKMYIPLSSSRLLITLVRHWKENIYNALPHITPILWII